MPLDVKKMKRVKKSNTNKYGSIYDRPLIATSSTLMDSFREFMPLRYMDQVSKDWPQNVKNLDPAEQRKQELRAHLRRTTYTAKLRAATNKYLQSKGQQQKNNKQTHADNKGNFKVDKVKYISFYKEFKTVQNLKTEDNFLLSIIKGYILKCSRLFLVMKYMLVNINEFFTICHVKKHYFYNIYISKINNTSLIKKLLKYKTQQQNLKLFQSLKLYILTWLVDLLNTPIGIFTFWYGLFSAIIIYLLNSIIRILLYLPSLLDVFCWSVESTVLDTKHKITVFQLLNVYKEIILLKLASMNLFFEFIYNYFCFMYIHIFEFININLLNSLNFDWQQKIINISNAVYQWDIFHFLSEQEEQFLFINGDALMFKKGIENLQHILNTMVKSVVSSYRIDQDQIEEIFPTKGINASFWSDWLKLANVPLDKVLGIFGLNRSYHYVPILSMDVFPRFYDLKLSQIHLNPTDQPSYIFSLFNNTFLKIYNIKILNIGNDLKMLFEFFLFQSFFCLLSFYYFQIIFKQREFPNPFLPFYHLFYLVPNKYHLKQISEWKHIYGYIDETNRTVVHPIGMLAEIEFYFREYTFTAFPGVFF